MAGLKIARALIALVLAQILFTGAWAQTGPTLVIYEPRGDPAHVEDIFKVSVATANGTFEVVSMTAQVGAVAVPLTFSSNAVCPFHPFSCFAGWSATMDIGALPLGNHTLTVTAQDAAGNVGTATRTIVHDRLPRLTVRAPVRLDVARNALRVTVDCFDESGCSSISATLGANYTVSVSGPQTLDTLLDVTGLAGSRDLLVTGQDNTGQVATVSIPVFIEGSPRLKEVADVPGYALDGDATRVLYANEARTQAWIRDRATLVDTLVYTDALKPVVRARLTQTGAVIVGATDSVQTRLVSFENGAATELGSANAASLAVQDRYFIWMPVAGTQVSRRDVVAGATLPVDAASQDQHDVAPDGTVVYWDATYNVRRMDPSGAPITLVSAADPSHWKVTPRTDGTTVLFRSITPCCAPPQDVSLVKWVGGVETEMVTPVQAASPGTHAVANGWMAYPRKGASGVTQVWRTTPGGTTSQVSFFSQPSSLLQLDGDGTVLFANGSIYLASPGDAQPQLIAQAAAPFRRNGTTYAVLGRKLFEVIPRGLEAATPLDFGTSPAKVLSGPKPIVITNAGSAPASVTSVSVAAPFNATHDCTTLAPGATCTVQTTFFPQAPGAYANSLTVTNSGEPLVVTVRGVADAPLAGHYYRSILGRPADAGGEAFWLGMANHMVELGGNINEGWFAMAASFFAMGEYGQRNRDDAGFVTDLYLTFFNRAPDGSGLAFWTGQLGAGMPREVALASFMFSPEFKSFTQGIFGTFTVRAEVDMVFDFYRGLLGRFPDDGGFTNWRNAFRAAQCQGAGPVAAAADSISSAFLTSPEYTARNRTNGQFVGDLYNAFQRRGGEIAGVQFWIQQLANGTLTRDQVRQAFVASPEFQQRVQAVVAQGCLP